MSHTTSLYGRVFAEGFSNNLRQALAIGMQTPERYGGPPQKARKPKKTAKPKEPLAKRLKRLATDAGRTMFPPLNDSVEHSLFDQVFTESKEKLGIVGSLKKIGRDVHEYMDVSDSSHPWNKIISTAQKWSDQGGALAGGDKSKSQAKPEKKSGWGADALKTMSSSKSDGGPKSQKALVSLKKSIKSVQQDREHRQRTSRELQSMGKPQSGASSISAPKQSNKRSTKR